MANIFAHVPYRETGYFSKLVTDYIADEPAIRPFYRLAPTAAGVAQAIQQRSNFPVNRPVLVAALNRQYTNLTIHPKAAANINSLLDNNTYTVCTAHQPNLLTGYLYFIYKILHAIKLADELNTTHTGKHFVPVYYMGSEDNDLEELGTFRFRDDKYVWDGNGQTGAVGRMDTASLQPMLKKLFRVFGPPGKDCDQLQDLLSKAYLKHKTIGEATQYLVNELFGRFGLVVLDPDDAALKATFIPVMEDELLHQKASPIISKQIALLGAHYKIQAHPREINLFYLKDNIRERIEKTGDSWTVLNTDLRFTESELLIELQQHPERFSPNVMLRGLYQETILPDVAFIGGGAEVAYWLQLQTVFEHYQVFYPSIHLRQSVMCIGAAQAALYRQLELNVADVFKPEHELIRAYIAKHSDNEWQTKGEAEAMEVIFNALQVKATALDPTLGPAAAATLTKMRHRLQALEQKMLRAEKRKMQTEVQRIERLKKVLFPNNGLQERVENFTEYYLMYGPSFFDTIMQGIVPLANEFLVIEG